MGRDRICNFTVSPEFLAAVKSSGRTVKGLAIQARIPVQTFYKIAQGVLGVEIGDERIMAVCEILGFDPREAFAVRFGGEEVDTDGQEQEG